MKNYLFYDKYTGEEFIVETDMKEKAYLYAYKYFKEPKFCGEVSNWEAKMSGLDTYERDYKMNELKILNDYLMIVVKNNTHCKTCEFNHSGICFFASECVAHDFIHYMNNEKKD